MPTTRDPVAYHIYIEARKLWHSKPRWQLSRVETMQILADVRKAADLGDWGARALMAHFYLHGLGVLDTNSVLDVAPEKAIEIDRLAAKELQPWALYDLGVAYEQGYGGVPYDTDMAWAYFLKAAQLGSPEAQMALASAYSHQRRFKDEETMTQCAYRQGHGPAAYALGMDRKQSKNVKESIIYFQQGVKYGDMDSALSLYLLFERGYWLTTHEEERATLKRLGVTYDPERSRRYRVIYEALQIDPDLRLNRLDLVLPLPPAELPAWSSMGDAIAPEPNGPPSY
jgi:TPR repeat protein